MCYSTAGRSAHGSQNREILMQTNSNVDVLRAFFEEINRVQQHNRSLVIITQGFIELFINRIIDKKLKHGKKRITSNNRDFPLSVKLTLLNELNHIDDKMYSVLNAFRKIRFIVYY